MPEWLTNTFASDTELGLRASLARLTVALVLGIAVAGIYRFTRGARTQRPLLATLVMLSVLLSITTLVIGDNVARAFSIVGALSIVRFRTVVDDTRDTAFVIFAVAVGMAAGAGYFMIPFVSLPFVFLAAWTRVRVDGQDRIRVGCGKHNRERPRKRNEAVRAARHVDDEERRSIRARLHRPTRQ